jgi:cytochrome c-type biogenesis protein CcmE
MTRKRKRLLLLLICGLSLSLASTLILSAFSSNLVFFVSPSELTTSTYGGRKLRLGGLVARGTVERSSSTGSAGVRFIVTDGNADVLVVYRGILPDLFREGQGVVVLGARNADGVFQASEVLAKHDETYMPKDVAEALKKSGRWNPDTGQQPPVSNREEQVRPNAGLPRR